MGAAGRDVSRGQPGGECHVPERCSAEAISGGSGRIGEEVSVSRRQGGQYAAPRPGCNYRTLSIIFLTHYILILSNEGGGQAQMRRSGAEVYIFRMIVDLPMITLVW